MDDAEEFSDCEIKDSDREILVPDEVSARPIDQTPDCGLVYLASAVAAIGGLLFGYDVGIINSAKGLVATEMELGCWQQELVVSIMAVGALAASLVAGPLLNWMGRRNTVQLTAVAFAVGAVVMGTAVNFSVLLVGRFIVGFGVSLSAMAECLYISEIATPATRGRLVSLNELGITVGFLVAFFAGYCLVETEGGWRIMFGLSGGLAVIQALALCYLPQTPHFLMMTRKEDEAASVLKRLRGPSGTRQEFANIRLSCQEAEDSSCVELASSKDNMRGRLVIGLGLVVLQQMTGQPNVLYYSTDIFKSVGFCGDLASALASVGLGVVKVAVTVVSILLVDKIGRRKLLLVGTSIMAVSLTALVVFASYQLKVDGNQHRQTCSDSSNASLAVSNTTSNSLDSMDDCSSSKLPASLRYIAFVSLLLYVSAYSISFGPVTWVILGEIFPLSSKGHAMSLAQAVNWIFNIFVSATFLDAVRAFSLPGVFTFYLLMTLVAIVFIYLTVPETKNKSLESISKELKNTNTLARISENLRCCPCLRTCTEQCASERSYSSKFELIAEDQYA